MFGHLIRKEILDQILSLRFLILWQSESSLWGVSLIPPGQTGGFLAGRRIWGENQSLLNPLIIFANSTLPLVTRMFELGLISEKTDPLTRDSKNTPPTAYAPQGLGCWTPPTGPRYATAVAPPEQNHKA